MYGKCLENVRKYKNIKIVNTQEYAQKYANKCQYSSFEIIDKDLVCLDLIQEKVRLCKPVYAGMVSWCF